jgi:hypothetical protein
MYFFLAYILGLNATSCSRVLEKSRKAIYLAQNSDTEHTFANLQLPKQRRDKLISQKPLFKEYIATLPTRSGPFVIHLALLIELMFRPKFSMFFWLCNKVLPCLSEVLQQEEAEASGQRNYSDPSYFYSRKTIKTNYT